MQSLVDYAPSFLGALGLEAPLTMSGVDQSLVWRGEADAARDHVLVENRHQPTTVFANTYVDGRYKITAYFGRSYGELFDLVEDPGEIRNLWDDPASAGLKSELLLKLVHAEMGAQPLVMPRIWGA